MNYGKITYMDTANGIGLRTTLFVSGCRHHCKNCFNHETWNFGYGKPFTEKERIAITKSLDHKAVKGITFLGGEPMEPENQFHVLSFIRKLKKHWKETNQEKDIWIYTGCTWEDLMDVRSGYHVTNCTEEILKNTDVLVDGPFIEPLMDLIGTPFRGSRNQRLIAAARTMASEHPEVPIEISIPKSEV